VKKSELNCPGFLPHGIFLERRLSIFVKKVGVVSGKNVGATYKFSQPHKTCRGGGGTGDNNKPRRLGQRKKKAQGGIGTSRTTNKENTFKRRGTRLEEHLLPLD